jgi:hypothetical protein
MQYFGYLRRNPNDGPEATLDFQGYDFWLNSFNGNYIQAEMVNAFLSSIEYSGDSVRENSSAAIFNSEIKFSPLPPTAPMPDYVPGSSPEGP